MHMFDLENLWLPFLAVLQQDISKRATTLWNRKPLSLWHNFSFLALRCFRSCHHAVLPNWHSRKNIHAVSITCDQVMRRRLRILVAWGTLVDVGAGTLKPCLGVVGADNKPKGKSHLKLGGGLCYVYLGGNLPLLNTCLVGIVCGLG